jgi:hypothetical protein
MTTYKVILNQEGFINLVKTVASFECIGAARYMAVLSEHDFLTFIVENDLTFDDKKRLIDTYSNIYGRVDEIK